MPINHDMGTINVSARKIVKGHVTARVVVHGTNHAMWRIRLSRWIFYLAGRIGGFKKVSIEIATD